MNLPLRLKVFKCKGDVSVAFNTDGSITINGAHRGLEMVSGEPLADRGTVTATATGLFSIASPRKRSKKVKR